jgi:hypothetical protein
MTSVSPVGVRSSGMAAVDITNPRERLTARLLADLERRPGNVPEALRPVSGEALAMMKGDGLLEPTIASRIWPVRAVESDGIVVDDGTWLPMVTADQLMPGARNLAFVVCGMGTAVEVRISELFSSRRYRLALAMDVFANRALFRLSDRVRTTLRRDARALGLGLGQPFEPGNEGFPLGCQTEVVRLAGGLAEGFSVTTTGMMKPIRSLDFVAAMGTDLPVWQASRRCQDCPSGSRCLDRSTPGRPKARNGLSRQSLPVTL